MGHFSPFKSSKIEHFKCSDSISTVEENSRDNLLVFTKESTRKHAGETPLHPLRNFNKAEPQPTTYFLTKKRLIYIRFILNIIFPLASLRRYFFLCERKICMNATYLNSVLESVNHAILNKNFFVGKTYYKFRKKRKKNYKSKCLCYTFLKRNELSLYK